MKKSKKKRLVFDYVKIELKQGFPRKTVWSSERWFSVKRPKTLEVIKRVLRSLYIIEGYEEDYQDDDAQHVNKENFETK